MRKVRKLNSLGSRNGLLDLKGNFACSDPAADELRHRNNVNGTPCLIAYRRCMETLLNGRHDRLEIHSSDPPQPTFQPNPHTRILFHQALQPELFFQHRTTVHCLNHNPRVAVVNAYLSKWFICRTRSYQSSKSHDARWSRKRHSRGKLTHGYIRVRSHKSNKIDNYVQHFAIAMAQGRLHFDMCSRTRCNVLQVSTQMMAMLSKLNIISSKMQHPPSSTTPIFRQRKALDD